MVSVLILIYLGAKYLFMKFVLQFKWKRSIGLGTEFLNNFLVFLKMVKVEKTTVNIRK